MSKTVLESEWQNEDTLILPIRVLNLPVGIENKRVQDQVLESIEDKGLLEPISVACITRNEWEDNMGGMCPPPESMGCKEYVLRVQMGCNRVRAAMLLGYEWITCNVHDSVDEAIKFGLKSRKRGLVWRTM